MGSCVYWSCASCHTLWFDNKENDFLTLEETEALAKKFPKKTTLGKNYSCPRCNQELYKDDYYFRCSTCGGVLSEPSALAKEQMNKAKRYAKDGRFTLSQIRSVVVLAAVFVFFGINYVMISAMQRKSTIQTQAAELLNSVHVRNVSNNQMALFFTTDQPLMSAAHFYTPARQWNTVINQSPRIDHFIVFDKPDESATVTIILSDTTGRRVASQEINLSELR